MIIWKINSLKRNIEDGFVTSADWSVALQDGEFNAYTYATCKFSGKLVTPYENLTEEQVLSWVWEQIDKAEIESNLSVQIEAQKNPISATGVPLQWKNRHL